MIKSIRIRKNNYLLFYASLDLTISINKRAALIAAQIYKLNTLINVSLTTTQTPHRLTDEMFRGVMSLGATQGQYHGTLADQEDRSRLGFDFPTSHGR